jgi:pimeloyl-ACP methyl ester carboxylesterase
VRTPAVGEQLETVASQGLRYYRGGSAGLPVVVVNALGQDLRPWARLVAALAPRRVLTWRLRGLPPDPPVRFDTHIDDLSAVLDAERVDACHLVSWCTGFRTAVGYQRRQPARVRSVVALSPSFKHRGRAAELDTGYERDLETL